MRRENVMFSAGLFLVIWGMVRAFTVPQSITGQGGILNFVLIAVGMTLLIKAREYHRSVRGNRKG